MSEMNDAAKMLDGDSCKVHLQESEKLLEPKESRNLQMYIEFSDLRYSIRCRRNGIGKTILNNVTGHFEPGKITVIIGPSGAGKTTLLNIIVGIQQNNVKGTITVNGVKPNREMFRKQVCYVPQQFDLLPSLTTRETLYIAVRLKLDVNQTKQAIYSIVNDIAESLNLSNCLDTLAKKLSGGERKRLSIGVQMITKPSILLLDEPTSGLDSVASNQLFSILHDLTRQNCTVVCAIHQPSSQMIMLFDNIMVLDRGRCMYCGPKSEILNIYRIAGFTCPSFYNIVDFVLEVVTEQRSGDLENLHKICHDEYEKFRSHNKYDENELTELQQKCQNDIVASVKSIVPKKSTWQEQKILFQRALICIKRDNILTKFRLFMHILNGLLLGVFFYNFGNDAEKVLSNIGCLFSFILLLFFANAMPTVQMFPTEATVFLQEHLNNWYSLRSYYSVKILTDLPLQIFCVSSFLFIAYYMTGQPMEYVRVLQMWSVCLLTTILGQTIGIFIGAVFGSQLGLFMIPAISIPLLLFAGYITKLREISIYLRPLSTVSFFRFIFEGMLQAIYLDRSNLACLEIYCFFRSPNKILSTMDMPTMPFHIILIILGSWIICLHIIIYAIFCWKIYYAKK